MDHELNHVSGLITDYSQLLRRRLHAGHMNDNFAPQEPSSRPDIHHLMRALPQATKATDYSHMAELLARFHKNSGGR